MVYELFTRVSLADDFPEYALHAISLFAATRRFQERFAKSGFHGSGGLTAQKKGERYEIY